MDLSGGCLVPAFSDPHHHVLIGALLESVPRCDSAVVRGLDDLLELLRSAAQANPGEGWVVVSGLDLARLREQRFPTADQIEAVVPGRPAAILCFSLHEAAVNRAGLTRLGPDCAAGRPGDLVTGRDGRPTGEVRDFAAAVLLRQILEEGSADWTRCEGALARYTTRLAAAGITEVTDPGLDRRAEELLRGAAGSGGIPIGVTSMAAAEAGLFLPPVDRLAEEPRQLKLFVDGGAFAAMSISGGALMMCSLSVVLRALTRGSLRLLQRAARYTSVKGPDGRYHSGALLYGREQLRDTCRRAMQAGWSLALHAQGNEAIELALDALAQRDRSPADGRPDQIVHFTFPTPAHCERARQLGVALVVQPAVFARAEGDWTALVPRGEFYVGPPLRQLADAGVLLAGSSDAPVGGFDPLAGMAAAMRPWRRPGPRPSSRDGLGAEQALRLYTTAAARTMGASRSGQLKAGEPADLVHLSADPLGLAADEVARLRVRAVYREGRRIWPPEAAQ